MSGSPANRSPPAPRAQSQSDLTPWGFPRLKTCPKCDYSLAGLPAQHRCPECGLAYDEFSCEWAGAPPPWKKDAAMAALVLVLFAGLYFFFAWWLHSLIQIVFAFVFIAQAGGLIMLRRWKRRLGYSIALLPDGVHIKREGQKTLVPWAEVRGVRVVHGRFRRGVRLYRRVFGMDVGLDLRCMVGAQADWGQFAIAIENRRRRHAQDIEESRRHA